MHKVLVAEPIYHAMPPDVYFNRIAFWQATWKNEVTQHPKVDMFGPKIVLDFKYRVRPYVIGPRAAIRNARDKAIHTALEEKATHLFFLDDDILTPPDILLKLLELDKPIVGALVHRDNGDPLVFKATSDGGEEVWRDHPKQGVFECAATAAGCMLIKTEVLESMNDTRWIFNYDETERSMGVRFCRFAKKHGWTVWCSPDVECKQVIHS